MSRRNHEQGRYWLNVRLDPELDADLINWLQGQHQGRRSEAVREAIRRGLGLSSRAEVALDLDAIRQVVADELARSFANIHLQVSGEAEVSTSIDDAESKYGAKLDLMLGRLTMSNSTPDDH